MSSATKKLKNVGIEKLRGRIIKDVSFGHPQKQERTYDDKRVARNSYGVLTIETDKGTMVLSCSMLASELSVWEEK